MTKKILNKLFFFSLLISLLFTEKLKSQSNEDLETSDSLLVDDLLSYVEDFISLPKGGTPWSVFGETGMDEYPIVDKDGNEWTGVKPVFKDEIKKLDSKEILVQGYMFPLDQAEKQSLFLLVPFPLSCPYHPHVSSNLLLEIHAKDPIIFSYDPVNIRGKLELVPKDDEYNVFFRLNNAKLVSK